MMTLPNWDNDKSYILDRLKSSCAVKVCAKTLDESQFTEGWIEHHLKIFGPQGIIIADNGTTDDRVLQIYDRWQEKILIFQFAGPHNQLHCHPRFKEFFDTIAKTCTKFAFIDIDERLVRILSDSWSVDPTIAIAIAETPSAHLVPTAWLINKMRSMDSFFVRDQLGSLGIAENVRMGKPFFPSNLVGQHCEIHNFQYGKSQEFELAVGGELFLLHFTQFPERRIMTNKNKLISRGIISKDCSDEDVLTLDIEKFSDRSFLPLIDEIRWMKSLIDMGASVPADETDMLRLNSDGTLFFSSEKTRDIFLNRRLNFASFFRQTIAA